MMPRRLMLSLMPARDADISPCLMLIRQRFAAAYLPPIFCYRRCRRRHTTPIDALIYFAADDAMLAIQRVVSDY